MDAITRRINKDLGYTDVVKYNPDARMALVRRRIENALDMTSGIVESCVLQEGPDNGVDIVSIFPVIWREVCRSEVGLYGDLKRTFPDFSLTNIVNFSKFSFDLIKEMPLDIAILMKRNLKNKCIRVQYTLVLVPIDENKKCVQKYLC